MKSLTAQFLGRLLAAFCVTFAAAALTPAFAEDVFEGRVKMKMTAGSEEQSIDYFLKGDNVRVELDDPRAQGGLMLMNLAKKEIQMVMPAQKMYMTMSIPDVADESEGEAEEAPKPTGEKKKILGYDAEQYIIQSDGNDYEIWATDELGTFGALRLPGKEKPGAASPLSSLVEGQKFFPLLIIENKNGREQTRVEVTEVEKKKLEDSLFEVPAGYRGMKMPMGAPMR